jgi:integrase
MDIFVGGSRSSDQLTAVVNANGEAGETTGECAEWRHTPVLPERSVKGDWSARMLHIPRTKNEESLHVPLNGGALAALKIALGRGGGTGRIFRSERTGEPLEHPRHWFEPALTDAGVEGFHWHDLRHTFASRLRMKGTPLEDTADLLGHKSLAMTKRYAHFGPTRLHEVVARLMEKHSESGTESGTGEIVPVNDDVVSFVN